MTVKSHHRHLEVTLHNEGTQPNILKCYLLSPFQRIISPWPYENEMRRNKVKKQQPELAESRHRQTLFTSKQLLELPPKSCYSSLCTVYLRTSQGSAFVWSPSGRKVTCLNCHSSSTVKNSLHTHRSARFVLKQGADLKGKQVSATSTRVTMCGIKQTFQHAFIWQ